MSRYFGGGRGGHSRRGDTGDSERHYGGGQRANSRGGGRGRGRGRHPPGLKGKEIGLYYHNKAIKNRERQEQQAYFCLDPVVEAEIESLLVSLKPLRGHESDPDDKEMDHFSGNYSHIKDSQFKRKYLDNVRGSIQQQLAKALLTKSKLVKNEQIDKRLMDEQIERQARTEYKSMLEFRSKLPSYVMKEEILDIIHGNQVVVISGETGCGKTTQIAQFILDDEIARGRGSTIKIICTQPRRISTISVADRVAAERAEKLGTSVGYQIRLEKVIARDYGSIMFCTTGLLLQYMQGDPALRDFSHIILDEIHERNTESDFIITLLKQVIPKRPDLKLILMSATLNSESFCRYYDNCPNIHIPGFTYPVKEYYLEDILQMMKFQFSPAKNVPRWHLRRSNDARNKAFENFMETAIKQMEAEKLYPSYVINELRNPNSEQISLELIQELIEYICANKGPGAILVFLPGMMDISKLHRGMLKSGKFPSHRCNIYPLHSRLPTMEQKLIFSRPVDGVRKIIIATSIAETSITIEDVVFVIDCGKTKLTRFDIARNLETLEPEWISLANAKQRRGRAGRVSPGECYRLYTKPREMSFDQFPTPEMLRAPLEQVILQAKILQLGKVDIFLGSVMDPPEDRAIKLSLDLLRTLNAIDNNEQLTPLGYHLAKLPLDPRTGKMILWAAMFSCVEPVFAIAASLAFKDAFYCPLGKEEQANAAKLDLGMGLFSDHIALGMALRQYEKSLRSRNTGRFCSDYFLSWNTLNLLSDMKQQFAKHLYEMKFLDSDDPSDSRCNRNSANFAMIKAIVSAGLFPNVATVKNGGHLPKLRTAEDGTVKIHPSSINAKAKWLPTPYVTYFLKKKSTAIYLHDTTCVNEAALIFAAPRSFVKVQGKRSLIVLNDSLSFLSKHSTAALIQRLREEMDQLLQHKITHPGTIKWHSQDDLVLRAIIHFVSEDNNMNMSGETYYLDSDN